MKPYPVLPLLVPLFSGNSMLSPAGCHLGKTPFVRKTLFPILLLLTFTCLLSVSPVQAALTPAASRSGFYFDTVITISMYDTADESILDNSFSLMARYEQLLSRTIEGSDIWQINHAKGEAVAVSEQTLDLVETALEYCRATNGAFDITIAPVVSLWDFHEDATPALPDPALLEEAVRHVDYRTVQVDSEAKTVRLFDPEASIDLGAIAKGYISDRLRDQLLDDGCSCAMINLGGNVLAVGKKPDGSPWKIGIRKPFGTSDSDLCAVVPVEEGAVITSGTYERYFHLDGVLYHHILNPADGYPVLNSLTSVTIVSQDGTVGDALSTSCFVLGPEEGMKLIESLDGVEAFFLDEDGNKITSSGWPG